VLTLDTADPNMAAEGKMARHQDVIEFISNDHRLLTSRMLGEDGASNPSTARDALGELCNMIAGNFKGKISQLADRCMLSVPTVISGEDYSMSATDPSQGVTITLLFDGEPICLSLIIQN